MGYQHIDNLYKNQDVLLFRECFAMEKVHGTSAHIAWRDGQVTLFSGGAKHDDFRSIIEATPALERLAARTGEPLTIYGEAYGGKMQGMRDTYGPELRFIAFEVRIGSWWLSVPQAEEIAVGHGLEFVPYVKSSTELAELDMLRDAPSVVAYQRGCGEKHREGIVIRPLIEVTKNNGNRIIAKHKGEAFSERVHTPKVRPEKLEVIAAAQAIADEWVTEMRLAHVLDKLPSATGIEHTGDVIRAMIEDVEREAAGEIVVSADARRAIGTAAAVMYKRRVTQVRHAR
jgi:hypothetical protein